jgi:hypothetical protein
MYIIIVNLYGRIGLEYGKKEMLDIDSSSWYSKRNHRRLI